MQRVFIRRLLLILLLFAGAIAVLLVPEIRVADFSRGGSGPLGLRLGLDLRGGLRLIYQAEGDPTPEQMGGVVKTIERRINAFGVTEPVIQVMDNDRVLVELPGVTDPEEAKKLIGETANLVFKWRHFNEDGTSEDRDIGLTGEHLARAFSGQASTTGFPIVNINFNSEGSDIFSKLTSNIAGTQDQIAIFLDQQELIAPVVRSPILGGQAYIEGRDFTQERVRLIAIQLESGRLPVPIRPVLEQDTDATLGADSLRKSLIAGVIGFGMVLLFMVAYYKVPGLLAGLALVVYTALVLAIFKIIPVTLTLAGIAGFILSVGMAVDANILIFERMKEELRSGRSLVAAIETGFNRAWPSIRDSNVSTFITCAILYWFGSRLGASLVTGFAVTLFIGVAVSMFSAITVSRTFLRLVAFLPLSRNLTLFTPVPLPGPGEKPSLAGERR
ncbi:MAG: protein translocase subunit SecD [Chloroflexi bacterium]|nr:protein translocase subunit SecD [Chloroflexota bacterium]